ncbi:3D domain protein [Latilactobacillus graminis DSM 20719]|uniref:3D domain protein n=2 Tax=Latilactobacillus graminis TaxID=60519 RepID=A0AA89I1A2_9LACO|nr:3D domain protein [Latilactobacillus graminis DSM 20719]
MLAVATGLVAMVTMGTSVSAASLSELKAQESRTQKNIDDTNSKIQVTLTSVNAKYQEINSLKEKIKENTESIDHSQALLKKQQAILAQRKGYAKERLQSLQRSADDRNVINALLSADSLSDFFNRAYTLTILQSANNHNMDQLVQSYRDTQAIQTKLQASRAELDGQRSRLDQQSAELEQQVNGLKNNLSQSQAALATIAKEKIAEQAREAAKAEAAQKAASETAKAASSTADASVQQADLSRTAVGKAGQTIQVEATAYSTVQPGLSHFGATGIDLTKNPNCIAVDPSVIPLGSLVLVPGYGYAIAGDTGSAIKGHIIDVHFPSVAQCRSWGRRHIAITIIK